MERTRRRSSRRNPDGDGRAHQREAPRPPWQPPAPRPEAVERGAESGAVGRQPHPSRGALEERETEVGFELPDLLTERRLGNVKAVGGPSEVQFLGHGDEGIEAPQVRQLTHAQIISISPNSSFTRMSGSGRLGDGEEQTTGQVLRGGLLWRGLRKQSWPRVWREPEFKSTYDVVIIGGGVHGLATAYYLASNHGITNVAVVDKQYLGSGGSGRNTAIVRSNYLTPEGVAFYDRSLDLYNSMSNDLNLNVMFSERATSPLPTPTRRCGR